MLSKYRISRRQFLNPDNKVEITDVERETLLGADGEEYDLLRCYMDDVDDFKRGDTLLGVCEIPVMHTTYADQTAVFNFTDKMVVTGVSDEEKTISFYVDKYADLEINTIALQRIEDYNTGAYTDWVYVYFFNSHYFSNPALVTADDEESEDYSILRAPIHLYIDYYDTNGSLQTAKFVGDSIEYINITTLRIPAEKFSALTSIVFGDTASLSPTNGITGDTANLTFYRNAFKYSDTDFFSLFWDRPLQLLQIPLVQTFDTNMYQEDAMENFIADEEKKAIGTISDYEKDVYVPVTSGLSPVYKMIFNFHFREHRGDNWTVSSEGNWNGTRTDFDGTYDVLSLMGKSKDENYAYFSYNETDTPYDESFQSDLMSYLDFTNEDIRYQKNKVKKSFLRLSFYDSTNPASQNLLAYSTIFIDSGTLFTRYSKHFEDSPYSAISYDTDGDYLSTAQKLSGIRVNREPYSTMLPNSDTEDIEDVRLSSQLVVQDKYNSTSSSEGFYLYLWKSEDEGAEPRDIYMKAEFNHAGYGRTIPMMLPYWDYDGEEGSERGERRVKTFKEICDDWNIDGSQVSGYGVKTYMRYSYIHLKCQYDKDSGQYVYYPNVDVYKDMDDTIEHDESTLIFNLYEARMGEISDDTAVRSYEYDCDSLQSSLSLTYNTIPVAGGTACPTLTWTIYATDKETGKTRTFTQNNTPDAVISYTIESTIAENFDGETGCFSVGETEETAKIEVATVTVTVTFEECVDSATATAIVYQNAAEVEYCSGSNLQFYGDSMENVILPCNGCGGCWNCDSADEECRCEDCVDKNCECEDCECEVNSDSSCIRTISFTQTVTCKDMEYEFDSARYSLGEDDYIRWSFSPAENVEGVSIYPFGDDNEEHCKSVCVVSDGIYTSEDEGDYVTLGTVYVDMCVNGQCLSGTGFDVTQYTALIEWGTPTSKCTTWTIPGDEGDSIALGDLEFEVPITFICGDERTVINSDMYEEYGVTIEYHLEGNDYAYIDGNRIVVTDTNDTGAPRLVGYLEITVTIGDVSNTYYCDSVYQDVTSEIICDYSVPEIEIKVKSECNYGTPDLTIKRR